jgi:DNA-binding NarL/FixJ family response regulator
VSITIWRASSNASAGRAAVASRTYEFYPVRKNEIDDGFAPENPANRERQLLRMMADGLANKEIAG